MFALKGVLNARANGRRDGRQTDGDQYSVGVAITIH